MINYSHFVMIFDRLQSMVTGQWSVINGQWSVVNGGHSPQTQFIIAISRPLQAMHSSSVLLAGIIMYVTHQACVIMTQ